MQFICYPKCTTCIRAKKWLEDNNIKFDIRDIKTNNPTIDELKKWHKISGLPLKSFFNTSGLIYRNLGLKDKLKTMTEEEQLNLLSTDGMLVKRPIIISDELILIGFKEQAWALKLK